MNTPAALIVPSAFARPDQAITQIAVLPRRRVIRFRNDIADNLPAKKMTGLSKCICIGIPEEHQIFRLHHNNVILLVASDSYLSPRRANKTLNRY